MARKYNSTNRFNVKRGPYRKSRSRTLVYANGKKNTKEIKAFLEKIDNDKDLLASDKESIKNYIEARIEQYRARGEKLTSTSILGYLSKTKYESNDKYQNQRDRMLANMGLTMQDIADELGVDILDLDWIPNANPEKDSFQFKIAGTELMFELYFQYNGTGFRRIK